LHSGHCILFDCYLQLTIASLENHTSIQQRPYSNLFGHHGSFKEYSQTAKMPSYGLSNEQIADVLSRDGRSILEWQKALSQKSQSFHLALCTLIGLTLMSIQMDEIWSYLQKKKHQLWLFITLEAQTKFWVNFELGSRNSHTAHRLLRNIVYLMPWGFEHFLLVTTDKLAAYDSAIANCFEKVHYAYLQIVKQRRKRRLVTVKKRIVNGKETNFGNKTQNTSYIERFNLTLRQKVSYLQRKTLGYCKSQKNFELILWINLFDYNYCTFDKSLRQNLTGESQKFKRRYQHLTPAMKMDLTSTKLEWQDLILAPIPKNAHEFSTSTVL
jgi:IS1 family transposase